MRRIILLLMLFCFMQPAHAIKIGLMENVDKIYFGTATESNISDSITNQQLFSICKLTTYEIKSKNNCFELRTEDNNKYKISCDKIKIQTFNPNSYVCVNQKWYRGNISLINNNGNMTVINDLGIEDYVKGVTPMEMPSSWNHEALKAQSIAVRSYAIANLGKYRSRGFDLTSTTQDQVYDGVSGEKPSATKAVEETKGLVMTYDGKIISTMYSSSGGGRTKSAYEVWGRDVPYLQSVKSFDDDVKANGHGIGMTQYGAKNLADMGYNAYQILAYFYTGAHFAKINPEIYK